VDSYSGFYVSIILGFLVLVIKPDLFSSILGNASGDTIRLDAVLILVSIAFIAILAIGAWIGWTMATTPPPKPIEEITSEIEDKKEEPKVEETKEKPKWTGATDHPKNDSGISTGYLLL